ncbi:MAG TPA: dihydrodipicolinate synthase family protein [Anaerolineae bacterium]|nr:dihydrodipicolinate synthase family protein [Anaerolineae bacterium]
MFEGVYPPIPTPFVDGEVAHDKLADNLARWNQTDLAGYVVLGSNGEAVYLSEAERVAVISTARQAIAGDKLLIAGTGAESTRATIERTRIAADAGADAALVLTPCYYKGQMTTEALRRHYFALADASPIPILLYNMPRFTGLDLSAQTVLELAQHPNVVGIKDSGGNVAKLGAIIGAAPDHFAVLAGSGGFFYPALVLGAVGGVLALANVAPDQCCRIYRAAREGQHGQAQELQLRMIPLNAAVTSRFGIAGLKAALDLLGYYGGEPRSPLSPPGPDQIEEIRHILEEAGLLA